MTDSTKQVCKLAAQQASLALEKVANIRACLRVQTQNLDGEARRTAVAQREVLDDAEEAMDSIRTIREMLQQHSFEAEEIYDRYYDLLKSTFSLEGTLARTALSEEEAGTFVDAQHAAAEAKAVIDNSSYNDLVGIFLKKNHSFPTPQLAVATGVHMPELFS